MTKGRGAGELGDLGGRNFLFDAFEGGAVLGGGGLGTGGLVGRVLGCEGEIGEGIAEGIGDATRCSSAMYGIFLDL